MDKGHYEAAAKAYSAAYSAANAGLKPTGLTGQLAAKIAARALELAGLAVVGEDGNVLDRSAVADALAPVTNPSALRQAFEKAGHFEPKSGSTGEPETW